MTPRARTTERWWKAFLPLALATLAVGAALLRSACIEVDTEIKPALVGGP